MTLIKFNNVVLHNLNENNINDNNNFYFEKIKKLFKNIEEIKAYKKIDDNVNIFDYSADKKLKMFLDIFKIKEKEIQIIEENKKDDVYIINIYKNSTPLYNKSNINVEKIYDTLKNNLIVPHKSTLYLSIEKLYNYYKEKNIPLNIKLVEINFINCNIEIDFDINIRGEDENNIIFFKKECNNFIPKIVTQEIKICNAIINREFISRLKYVTSLNIINSTIEENVEIKDIFDIENLNNKNDIIYYTYLKYINEYYNKDINTLITVKNCIGHKKIKFTNIKYVDTFLFENNELYLENDIKICKFTYIIYEYYNKNINEKNINEILPKINNSLYLCNINIKNLDFGNNIKYKILYLVNCKDLNNFDGIIDSCNEINIIINEDNSNKNIFPPILEYNKIINFLRDKYFKIKENINNNENKEIININNKFNNTYKDIKIENIINKFNERNNFEFNITTHISLINLGFTKIEDNLKLYEYYNNLINNIKNELYNNFEDFNDVIKIKYINNY